MGVFLIELHDLFIGTGKAHFLILLAQINQITFHCFDEEFFWAQKMRNLELFCLFYPDFWINENVWLPWMFLMNPTLFASRFSV